LVLAPALRVKRLVIKRLFSGLAVGAIAFLSLWYHSLSWLLFLIVALALAVVDWGRLTGSTPLVLALLLLPAALFAALEFYFLLPLMPLLAAVPMLVKADVKLAGNPLAVAAGIIWLALPVAFLFRLRLEYEFVTVFGLLLATIFQDSCAYYCGLTLRMGKNFSGPISPNKSWAGFFGGLLATVAVSFLFSYYRLWPLDLYWGVGVGFLLGVVGPVGDLMISGLKRQRGLDDLANYLPGHGGVLDRVDALLMNTVCFYVVIQLLEALSL